MRMLCEGSVGRSVIELLSRTLGDPFIQRLFHRFARFHKTRMQSRTVGRKLFQQVENSASNLMEPLRYVWRLLAWLMLRLAWFSTQFVNLPGIHGKVHGDEDAPDPPPPPKPYLYYFPCDQKRILYMLNETIAARGVTNHSDYCSRPYHAQRVSLLTIPGSNNNR